MPIRRHCLFTWIVLATAWSGVSGLGIKAWADEPEYAGPESFLAQNQGAVYLAQARAFLASQPESRIAAQVLIDMVVAASVMRDAEQLKKVRLEILLEHPQSLAASFIIRSTPPQDLATVLREQLHRADPPLNHATLLQISTAIELLVRDHGHGAISDELWAAAALAQDSPAAAARLRRNIAKPDSAAAKLLDIALDRRLSPREQFVSLQKLAAMPLAQSYQQLLFQEQLQAEDRDTVEVRTVVVENLLRKNRFAAALPELKLLAGQTDEPRVHFCLAWAEASQGEETAALATLEALLRRSPDSPWAESAKQLIPIVASLDNSLAKHVSAVERMMRRFASGKPEKIEFVLEDAGPHDVRRSLRWQLSLPDDSFALVAYRGDQMMLAYEASAEGSRFFVQGDSSVKKTPARGVCPLFTFQHQLVAEGGQAFHFHFNMVPQGGFALAASFRNLFSLPKIGTTDGRIEVLRHLVRSGSFPEPAPTAAGDHMLRWRSLNLDAPTPHCVELLTTPDDQLLEVRMVGGWQMRGVKYGPRESTQFEPIVWPDVPVQEVKELQAAEQMRLFAALTSLVQS